MATLPIENMVRLRRILKTAFILKRKPWINSDINRGNAMTLKSLGFAIEVLSMFTKENPSWGLRDLSKEMGVNHTIIYRVLRTFEDKQVLTQNPDSKKYELGPGLAPLLAAYRSKDKMSDLILPIMEALSERTGESVFLTWKEGYEGVTVEIAESSSNIRFAVSKGTRTPLYLGASAKSIMAFLSEEQQNEIIAQGLKKMTEKSTTEKEDLLKDLRIIESRRWAYTEGEYSDDVFGISTPLFNSEGKILASLTIAGPVYRINEDNRQTILHMLMESTEKITEIISIFDKDNYL
ncbi:IclR family transcriptional regulator [Salinicoccus sesuvii]